MKSLKNPLEAAAYWDASLEGTFSEFLDAKKKVATALNYPLLNNAELFVVLELESTKSTWFVFGTEPSVVGGFFDRHGNIVVEQTGTFTPVNWRVPLEDREFILSLDFPQDLNRLFAARMKEQMIKYYKCQFPK